MDPKQEENDRIINLGVKKVLKEGWVIIPWRDQMDETYKRVDKKLHDMIIKHPNWEDYEIQEEMFYGIKSKLEEEHDIKLYINPNIGLIITKEQLKKSNILTILTNPPEGTHIL